MCAYVKLRPRRGSKSQWEYANPILSEGELAFECPETGVGTGPVNFKIGDGTSSYISLPYAFNAATLNAKVDDLANTVATYDSTIAALSASVAEMEEQVQNVRKIDIQASEPDDLLLGQIWINSDMVTGSIIITPRTATIEAGSSTRLTLTSTLSTVDSIEWKVSTPGIVTLSNTSSNGATITGIADGSVVVTASAKLGGAVIYTSQCNVTVSVSGALTITPDSARVIIGKTQTLTLTNTLTNYDSIQWTSSAAYYCSIEEQSNTAATVKGVLSGSATIYARAMLNSTAIATAQAIMTMVGMEMNKSSMSLMIGETGSISLANTMVEGTDYDTITWTSTGNNVAVVSSSSNTSASIMGVAAGNCTIKATAYMDGREVQSVSCTVGVTGSISLDKTTMNMMVGETGAFTVTNTLGEGNYDRISWTCSDSAIVTIDSSTNTSAIVTAVAAGSAAVTVTAYLNSQFVASSSCVIYVTGDISIDEDTVTIIAGSTHQLTLTNTLTPGSWNKITWGTGDSTTVEVVTQDDTSCTIRGLREGQATITAYALAGEEGDYTTVADSSCIVTVESN